MKAKHHSAPVLPAEQWAELHDYLTLALDALGTKPGDFTPDALRDAAVNLNLAARIARRAVPRIGGVA